MTPELKAMTEAQLKSRLSPVDVTELASFKNHIDVQDKASACVFAGPQPSLNGMRVVRLQGPQADVWLAEFAFATAEGEEFARRRVVELTGEEPHES